jgi:hypothetical protein
MRNSRFSYLFHLFMAYLTMLSLDQTVQCRITGHLVNDELERIWKEAVIA